MFQFGSIIIFNNSFYTASKGDVKSGTRELLHFEVDSLGDGCNSHPL